MGVRYSARGGSGTEGEIEVNCMEDRCLMCIVSRASGNARKGCLDQPKEREACELSQDTFQLLRVEIQLQSRHPAAPDSGHVILP